MRENRPREKNTFIIIISFTALVGGRDGDGTQHCSNIKRFIENLGFGGIANKKLNTKAASIQFSTRPLQT